MTFGYEHNELWIEHCETAVNFRAGNACGRVRLWSAGCSGERIRAVGATVIRLFVDDIAYSGAITASHALDVFEIVIQECFGVASWSL